MVSPPARGSGDLEPAEGDQPLLCTPRPHAAGDDLERLNGDPSKAAQQWVALRRAEWDEIEARVRRSAQVRDDFVTIPFPRLAAAANQQLVAATEAYRREAAIVDPRLTREVTCAFKATALSELCERLRADTGIQLVAGNSVADEKVTLFCKKQPLRDVMRQLSRPFGYAWLRSGKPGEFKYELAQDLKSQLLEEELRNRDRNEALLALEQEIERYRPYLSLSPDEALARARTAGPAEKKLLEKLAGWGWGPLQVYPRLSPPELATLRSGQTLTFVQGAKADELPLPPELAQGVLQSHRGHKLRKQDGAITFAPRDAPDALPPVAVPEVRPVITLSVKQSELGRFILDGESGFYISADGGTRVGSGPYAVGQSPSTHAPDNGATNIKWARDPALQRRVSLEPRPTCLTTDSPRAPAATPAGAPRVTSADVLEELHRATGLPVVSDYYTRLHRPEVVRITNQPLFDALNQVADVMRLRWHRDGNWLQFRSTTYYDDRLKEVPNRLLARWAAARRQLGALSLDELIEMAQMSDVQLDAAAMAEGIRECWGLPEWDVVRKQRLRPHLRCLGLLTPAQRRAAVSPDGLAFARMTLGQQQQFITRPLAAYVEAMQSLEELVGSTLRVGYTQPGGFGLRPFDGPWKSGAFRLALVREPTRTTALQSARRIDPEVDETTIVPSELAVTVIYSWGDLQKGGQIATRTTASGFRDWFGSFP